MKALLKIFMLVLVLVVIWAGCNWVWSSVNNYFFPEDIAPPIIEETITHTEELLESATFTPPTNSTQPSTEISCEEFKYSDERIEDCPDEGVDGCVETEISIVEKSRSDIEGTLELIEVGKWKSFVYNESIKVTDCGRARLEFTNGLLAWLVGRTDLETVGIEPGQTPHDFIPLLMMNPGTMLGFTNPNESFKLRTPSGDIFVYGSPQSKRAEESKITAQFGIDVSCPSNLQSYGQVVAMATGDTEIELTSRDTSTVIASGEFATVNLDNGKISESLPFNEDFMRLQELAQGPFLIVNKERLLIGNAPSLEAWNRAISRQPNTATDALNPGKATEIIGYTIIDEDLFLQLDCPSSTNSGIECWIKFDEEENNVTLVNHDSPITEETQTPTPVPESLATNTPTLPSSPTLVPPTTAPTSIPAQPPPIHPPSPFWHGETTQGNSVSFEVIDNSFPYFDMVKKFSVSYTGNDQCLSGQLHFESVDLMPITGQPPSFTILSPSFVDTGNNSGLWSAKRVVGQFTPGSTAEGTLILSKLGFDCPDKVVKWYATNQ